MERGGVLVRISDRAKRRFVFVPAEVVRGVVVLPAVTAVEGLRPPAVGVALANGEVVPVLCLDAAGLSPSSRNERTTALLCDAEGKPVAIVGRAVEAAGVFVLSRDGFVRTGDEEAEIVDVPALYRSAEAAIWSERSTPKATEVFP